MDGAGQHMPVVQARERARARGYQFQANLGYTVSLYLKTNQQKTKTARKELIGENFYNYFYNHY